MNASSVSDIAVDQAGNAYVTGSGWFDDSTDQWHGRMSGILHVCNQDQRQRHSSRVFRLLLVLGECVEWVSGIAVDQSGNVYVAGSTDDSFGYASIDGFVIKIDASGSRIVYHASIVAWSEYGDTEVWTSDIAVDAKGNAYVTGYRNTNCIPEEPCDPNRSTDAWVTKINAGTTGSFRSGNGHFHRRKWR